MKKTLSVVFFLLLLLSVTTNAQLCLDVSESHSKTVTCFLLPVEIGQGFILGGNNRITPYTASLRLSPTLGVGNYGKFQIGPTGGLIYTNPEVEFVGGARAAYQLYQLTAIAGNPVLDVFLTADFMFGSRGNNFFGAGVSFGLTGLFGIGPKVTYNSESKLTHAELANITLDLTFLMSSKIACFPPIPDWEPGYDPDSGFFGDVVLYARVEALNQFGKDTTNTIKDKLSSLSRDRIFSLKNVSELKTYLKTNGLDAIADKMNNVIERAVQSKGLPVQDETYQEKLIHSFVGGWCEAIKIDNNQNGA